MNGEMTPSLSDDERRAAQVAANVLNTSAEIRIREQEISSRIAELAVQRAEYEGSAERALASEMWTMTNRMQRIVKHPWRARREGESVVVVRSTDRNQFTTEPVPDGTILIQEGKEFVASGLVFSSSYIHESEYGCTIGTNVEISRLIENQNLRKASEEQRLYQLKTHRDKEIGERVKVYGPEFEEREKRVIAEFVQRGLANPIEGAKAFETVFLNEIAPTDDMYLRPLALVMHGNMLLGAKRK